MDLPCLTPELPDQPGIANRLDTTANLARAARGQAHSRPGRGLREAERPDPEWHEHHEPGTASSPRGEHAQEARHGQSQHGSTEQEATATTATLDVLCSRRRQEHLPRLSPSALGPSNPQINSVHGLSENDEIHVAVAPGALAHLVAFRHAFIVDVALDRLDHLGRRTHHQARVLPVERTP